MQVPLAGYAGASITSPPAGIAVMLGGLAVFGYGMSMLLRGRRLGQETADERLSRDPRTPVVFLRAFASEPRGPDDIFGFTKRYQLLPMGFGLYQGGAGQLRFAEDMDKIGPFIALGRPGEQLPGFGAARKYVPDSEWQATIVDWLSRAAIIVIWARPPRNEGGFDWELSKLVELNQPQRILLICPGRVSEYRRFKEIADRLFPVPLPEDLPGSWLLTFDRSWNPIALAAVVDREQPPDLLRTLQPLLDQNGIELAA